jgi:type IV pilus assembly protein PilW
MRYFESQLGRNQRGFTLTELMVALTLGLIVSAGIIQIVLSARTSQRIQYALTDLQESGRAAVWLLGERIRLAGYDNPATLRKPVYPAVRGGVDPTAIQITFEGGDDVVDCRGQAVAEDTVVTERFEVVDEQLNCSLLDQPLVDGIGDLHILYGLDTDFPPDGLPNRFVNAAGVGADWGQVTGVRLAVLALSNDEVGLDPDARPMNLLDRTVGPFDDRRLRAVFSTTVQLRN